LKSFCIKNACVLIILFFISIGGAYAQYVKIHGVVSDSLTGELLPFVNVVFKGKNIGTTTDIDGKYIIETEWGSNSLLFSSLGYKLQEIKLSKSSNQEINVKLVSTSQELKAFEVKSKKQRYRNKENPAVILIHNILEHRDENRGKTFDYFEYEKYIKRQYDLNNFTDKLFDTRGMEGFQVLRGYVDTSDLNGKPFLPILIQEKISSVYQRNHGRDVKEVVSATKLSGFDNGNISSGVDQFMSKIGGEVDVYESKILLFDKSFTSPISMIGPTIYRYYITDSTVIDSVKYMKLAFMPRNHTMIAFTGFMWVGDSTRNYAVKSIELNIDNRMNINFVDDMRITQDFEYNEGVGWHKVKDIMIVDFQLVGKTTGVYSTKTTSYSNFKVNYERPDAFYKSLNTLTYDVEEEQLPDEYWDEHRHEKLTKGEEGVYELADTIQNIRQFRTFNTIVRLLGSSYLGVKKVDLGPITSLVSYNTVEGIRVRAGFRTNLKFNKNWRFSGWGAYGFEDKRFKYKGEVEYFFSKNPFRRLSVSYVNNTFQPGFALKSIPPDHYLLSFRRTPGTNMFYVQNLGVKYSHEWFNGFSNSFEVNLRDISATRFNTLIHAVTKEVEDVVVDNSFSIGARFSLNERFLQGEYMRKPIKTSAPILKMKYTYSSPMFGSDYEYHKLFLRLEKRFMPGILGFTDVEIEGTKIWGKVPYPLLIIHRGNETISYEKNSFNMMNFMEFASDQSVGVFVEHHFNGLLLGFVPVVRNSKMRVVISGKMLVGSVSEKNRNIDDPELILKPERLGGLVGTPYLEGSAGIENIFNIFRIDMVQRFTYLDAPNVGNLFGVKGLGPRIAFKLKF
jgi:hypothetical protein